MNAVPGSRFQVPENLEHELGTWNLDPGTE
jgi:hypothetical protein